MGLHSEATTTIVRYRAAWPEDDRMQESLDNMLLDLFKHSRNLEGQIAVTGQLIAYSQKALAEGRTGWMIRTAGCKNTVSVHRRLSTLYRLRGQAQMQSGVWQEAEQSLLKALVGKGGWGRGRGTSGSCGPFFILFSFLSSECK